MLLELGVPHDLGVLFQRRGDLLLVLRWEHGAVLGHGDERNERVANMMPPANARPNDSPNDPGRRIRPDVARVFDTVGKALRIRRLGVRVAPGAREHGCYGGARIAGAIAR